MIITLTQLNCNPFCGVDERKPRWITVALKLRLSVACALVELSLSMHSTFRSSISFLCHAALEHSSLILSISALFSNL